MTSILVRCNCQARAAGVLLLAVFAAGCEPGTGSLSGTVTFKGQPLPGGIVAVVCSDGRVADSKIAPDGTYSIEYAPAGDLKVKVITQPPVSGMKSPNPMARNVRRDPGSRSEPFAPLGGYVPIPERYRDAERSGLSCAVVKGKQTTYDIPLEP